MSVYEMRNGKRPTAKVNWTPTLFDRCPPLRLGILRFPPCVLLLLLFCCWLVWLLACLIVWRLYYLEARTSRDRQNPPSVAQRSRKQLNIAPFPCRDAALYSKVWLGSCGWGFPRHFELDVTIFLPKYGGKEDSIDASFKRVYSAPANC